MSEGERGGRGGSRERGAGEPQQDEEHALSALHPDPRLARLLLRRRRQRRKAAHAAAAAGDAALDAGALVAEAAHADAAPPGEGEATPPVAAAAPKALPSFAEEKLRPGDDLPVPLDLWTRIIAKLPRTDGPSIIAGIPVKVSGIVVKRESFFVWLDGGRIVGWMPVEQLPPGGSRRGEWWIWSDGQVLQVGRRYAHDAVAAKAESPALEGHDLERRVGAGAELNRDIEAFMAQGHSLKEAIDLTRQVHAAVLVQMVQATFAVFSAWAGMTAAEGDLEALGDALGRRIKGATAKTPREGDQQSHAVDTAGRDRADSAKPAHVVAAQGDRGAPQSREARLRELAADPAHGGSISDKTEREAEIGLALEEAGKLPRPIKRDPDGRAEFIDGAGQKWDIKRFNSHYRNKGGYRLDRCLIAIYEELELGENIILDTADLEPEHVAELRRAISDRGWDSRIIWF